MRQFMNSPLTVVTLLVVAISLTSVPIPSTAQAPSYIVTDLGVLGGLESKAFDVNDSARVVGESTTAAEPTFKRPFVWETGTLTDLANFGGNTGAAFSVNRCGLAVGAADTATGESHPFIWSDIVGKTDLGTLDGGSFAIALDINNANQVVGQSEIGGPGVLQDRAFVWDGTSGMRAIATLGGSSNAARAINDRGQIVGFSTTASGETHAFLLSKGTLINIPTLGGRIGVANEINNLGQVVGFSTLSVGPLNPPFHAFLRDPGADPLDIGTLGGNFSIAFDINDATEIVGTSEVTPGVHHAFIYTHSAGMVDLNSLTIGSGWTLTEARGINDRGQIVGFGTNPSGLVHGFLLTPVDDIPEPPPCTELTPRPIVLPASKIFGKRPPRLSPKFSRPGSRRKPAFDLFKL